MTGTEYSVMRDAYICMLKVPPTSELRTTRRFQRTLAGLRDLLAREEGLDAETFQWTYEWSTAE